MAIDFGSGTTSGTATLRNAGIGAYRLGEATLGSYIIWDYEQLAFPRDTSADLYITQYNSEYYGPNLFNKPRVISITAPPTSEDSAMTLSFYNKSGGIHGRISTDIQKPIIQEIRWQDDANGNGDATIKLSRLPNFPLIDFMQVGIRFGVLTSDVYRGYIRVDQRDGSTRDGVILKCNGLREQLNRISVDRTINGPADIGSTVSDIYSTDIAPNTDITSITQLDTDTGVTHQSNIEFAKDTVFQTMEILSSMGNAEFGVDGRGGFFYSVISDEIVKTFYVGYTLLDFEPKVEIEQIKNSILVQRNQQGSGGSGWTIASIKQDLTSQAKYGFREQIVKIPGYFGDADSDTIGDAVLAELKDPKVNAKISFNIASSDQIIGRGNYRFVTRLDDYEEDISECDDASEWQKIGSGDLTISDASSPVLSGAGSIQLSYTSALNDRAQLTLAEPIAKKNKLIRFYIRSARKGSYLSFGFGRTSWNEHTLPIPINVSNTFQVIEFDIEAFDKEIGVIAIQIDDYGVTNDVYIDRVTVNRTTNLYYEMRYYRAEYNYRPGGLTAEIEFGPPPNRMEDFIDELTKLEENNRSAGEKR